MEEGQQGPSWLYTPPLTNVHPPVQPRLSALPFEELKWQDFERLCHRLVRAECNIEYSKLYGLAGQAQEGIDIYGRVTNSDKYRVYQCKNVQDYGPAKIAAAVDEFIKGTWLPRSDLFVLCTRESLRQTNRAEEVERQAQLLKGHDVSFQPWDSYELNTKLKSHAAIVDDFFGRPWVEAFCGPEIAAALGERLDAEQIRSLRKELYVLYSRMFQIHDRGVPIPNAVPFVDRYIIPDVEMQETFAVTSREQETKQSTPETGTGKIEDRTSERQRARQYSQRLSIQSAIIRSKRSLLFGEPGAGKSSFLRFLALDLLHEDPALTQAANKLGDHVPIWIPFALWTKAIASGPTAERSVEAIAESCLRSWDAKDLVPLVTRALKDQRLLLLVDGLDEYSSDQAAQIALNHLEMFLAKQDVPVVATTRPHGFERLGMSRDGWYHASIADLSKEQQAALARVWFRASSERNNPLFDRTEREKDVATQKDTFFAELDRSSDLKELGRNPLLLCLLISLQMKNVRLPVRRFDAYAALTEHLISIHPQQRRVAAEAPAEEESPTDDLKKTLAHLATVLQMQHPEGLISDSGAIAAIQEFAGDDQLGFGMSRHDSQQWARRILARAENDLGIIVKRSQDEVGFYHRTIQEYLVSSNVTRFPLDRQREIVAKYCDDPRWREVLLGLFQINTRPGDVEELIKTIRATPIDLSLQQTREELLCEVAFGNFNCPPRLARELAQSAIAQIETETWLPHRERLLRRAMDGLRSPSMSNTLKNKLGEWFPDRLGWSQAQLFYSLSEWERLPDVVEALFKGLNTEEYRAKRAAATTLAKVAAGDDTIRKRLEIIANNSDDPYVVAAAIESLMTGWLKDPVVGTLIHRAATSAVPSLRLLGIRGRIMLGIQQTPDLDALLTLADTNSSFRIGLGTDIRDALMQGWPRDERVKQICLESYGRMIYRGRRRQVQIDREVALYVLLTGYPMDEEVAAFCIDQITNERHPFLSLHGYEPYELLVKNFPNHQGVIAALDTWAEKAERHRGMEMSSAALLGRTPVFKQKLIEDLREGGSFFHWPARGLLDAWGMVDPEVASALNAFISDPVRASAIGHLLPRIIADKAECRKYLISLLRHKDCQRPDFVLSGLVELGTNGSDTEVVDAALDVLAREAHPIFSDAFKANLIYTFRDDSRVRDLAVQTLAEREGAYAATAHAFRSDPEIRAAILRILNPLPATLRQAIATYLSEVDVDDQTALPLLALYDYDRDDAVKIQSAIGYYTRLARTPCDLTHAFNRLADDIVCVGPDFEERRLAAFCGLVILDRLDIMDSKQDYGDAGKSLNMRTIRGFDVNFPAVRFLFKNWGKLQNYFKDQFWQRIFAGEATEYLWDKLSTVADEHPGPRQQALDFYRGKSEKVAGSSALQFLARAQPGSGLLMEYCLNTLGLDKPETPIPAAWQNVAHVTAADQLTAAQVLGRHFSDDPELPHRLYTQRKNDLQFDALVLALSEGWPESEELKLCFKRMAENRHGYWESTILRYYCFNAQPIGMYQVLRRMIRAWVSRPEYRLHESFVDPIVWRLQRDRRLRNILLRHISTIGTSSEKISFCKLLYRALGTFPELRAWTQAELKRQFTRSVTESGLDVTTGEPTSLPHVLYAVLSG